MDKTTKRGAARVGRALLVDDHESIRMSLSGMLRAARVVGEVDSVSSLKEAREMLHADASYDIIVLDLQLGDADGLEGLKALREEFPASRVLVFSATQDVLTIGTALVAGACGYVSKSAKSAVLLAAVRLILAGSRYIPPELLTAVLDQLPRLLAEQASASEVQPDLDLTPRQLEVLRLLLAGNQNKVIGARLGMAEGTVKSHLNAVFRALQVHNRSQATLKAHQRGIR